MENELLLTKNKDYWTFPSYRNNGINSIGDYPAMMVDAMQEELIDSALRRIDDPKTLLDPFFGAGTTLIIAQKKNVLPIGIDINPLAHLITYVKLYNYNVNAIKKSSANLFNQIEKNDTFEIFGFAGIDKWFRKDIISDLSKIRAAITLEKDQNIRRFFWVAFAKIVRKYSNSRSSTFKLHIKDKDTISHMDNHIIDDFIRLVNENTSKIMVDYKKGDFTLYCGDSISELNYIEDQSIDIICTSPPYGDNATTVTYGQFSTLQLRWIDSCDLDISTNTINCNNSSIDSNSLGGRKNCKQTNLLSINTFLKRISKEKRTKVISFMNDYQLVFNKMTSKLKNGGFLILTIGNRKVDNKSVPFDKANIELAKKNDLELVQRLSRKIVNKRMASKVSHLTNVGSVESMKEEKVLIFVKKEK